MAFTLLIIFKANLGQPNLFDDDLEAEAEANSPMIAKVGCFDSKKYVNNGFEHHSRYY